MFLLRIAILLFIIALFLPSTPEEKQQVYRSVSSAVENVQTFCVRNASLCDDVQSIAGAVVNRIHMGAQLVYDAAMGVEEEEPRWDGGRPYPSRIDGAPRREESRTRPEPARSTNTLRRDDLDPAWRGPGAS